MHHGRTVSSGHYTAFVRDALGQWRDFNDTTVSDVTEAHVMGAPAYESTTPYLLFYERV